MYLFELFLFVFIFCKIINFIFSTHRTMTIIINSILILLFTGSSFLFLELEFLGIAFLIVYVASILIILLFSILVIDFNVENRQKFSIKILTNFQILSIFLFAIFFYLILFNIIELSIFNIFTVCDFLTWINSDLTSLSFMQFFVGRSSLFHNSQLFNFFEFEALSISLFEYEQMSLFLIAFYMSLSIFVSLIICSDNIYNTV
jgi:hypothetical protein